MALSDLTTLVNATAQNTSQFKGLSAAYEFLGFGVPTIDGYTFLINNNNSTNFGAGPGVTFNDENIYINTMNALYQGNATAKGTFDALVGGGATLQDKLTIVYNTLVPVTEQTDAGRAYFTSQAAFYTARAAELGIPGLNGAALVGASALMKILVDQDVTGIGDTLNDLLAAVNNGTAVIPQGGTAFTPIETADGTSFDSDDSGGGVVPGQTFTLTDSTVTGIPDNVNGSAGNDTIRGPQIGPNDSLETVDTILGNAGTDTLNAVLNGVVAPVAPVLNSVENVFISPLAASIFDGSAATGTLEIWHSNAGLPAAIGATTLTIQGVSTNVMIGVQDAIADTNPLNPQTTTVNFSGVSGANDTANIVLSGTDPASFLTADNIEHFHLNVLAPSGQVNSNLTLNETTLNTAETVAIDGSGNLTLDATAAFMGNVNSIDASGMTGALTFGTLGTLFAKNATVMSGANADTLTVNGAAANVFTVNSGGGNDTINMNLTQQHSLTTGDGLDTVNLDVAGSGSSNLAAADTVNSNALIAASLKITDFTSSDVLNINTTTAAEFNPTGTQLTTAAGQANLAAAINFLAGLAVAGDTFAFQYGGDSYVFVDEVADGLLTLAGGDSLVQLTGVTAPLTAAQLVVV